MPRCRRRTVSLVLILGVFALLFCAYNRTPTTDDNEQYYGISYGPVVGMANCRVALASNIDIPHQDQTRHLRSMPACVTFTESGVLIGNDTKEHIVDNPHNTICGIKDLLGHKWSDPKLQAYIKNLPYEVVEVDDGPMIKIKINDETKLISPEYVYSILLGRLRDVAQEFLKENVTDAVVAVPAYYNDLQRQAVKDSGRTVNLTVLRIINEPTAASIAYSLDSSSSSERLALVYDMGATETNVAVLEIDAGVFDIIGTATASAGGNDFNKRVLDRITTMLEKRQWANITSDTRAVRKLWTAIDEAKKDISVNHSSRISLKELHNESGPNETVLTRAKFEDLNRDLFLEALRPVPQLLNDLKLHAGQIDDVVLVGGSVHIPKIQMMLEEYFNRKTLRGITPDHAIVLGAALQGAILSGIDDSDFVCCVEINPLSVGIETTRGVFRKIIPRNTVIPTRKTQNFTTVSDDQTSMLIRIFEGERVFTKNNKFLGELVLSGIRPAPKGEAVIQVSFEYHYDNIRVYAEDKETGHNATFSTEDTGYNRSGRFENLDQLIFEAEDHAQEDNALLETIMATIEIPNSVAAHEDLSRANEPQKEEL